MAKWTKLDLYRIGFAMPEGRCIFRIGGEGGELVETHRKILKNNGRWIIYVTPVLILKKGKLSKVITKKDL